MVPLPPTFKHPKRANGVLIVTISGSNLRITITSAGLDGISFEVILIVMSRHSAYKIC